MTKDMLLQSLCKACDRPLNWDTELLQSGYLDSLAMVLLEEEMEQVAHLSVPLTAEAHWGRNWLEAKG